MNGYEWNEQSPVSGLKDLKSTTDLSPSQHVLCQNTGALSAICVTLFFSEERQFYHHSVLAAESQIKAIGQDLWFFERIQILCLFSVYSLWPITFQV